MELLKNPIIYTSKTYGSGGASKHENRPNHIGEIKMDADTYNAFSKRLKQEGLNKV